MSPLDASARQLWHNVPALMFMDFWQTKNRQNDMRELARMLGVLWLREDAEEQPTGQGPYKRPEELRVPLACAIEPSIMDVVKQFFGKRTGIDPPGWAGGQKGELVQLYDVTNKEQFLKFVRGFVTPKIT